MQRLLQVFISNNVSAPQLEVSQSHKPGAPLRSLPHSRDFITPAVIIILVIIRGERPRTDLCSLPVSNLCKLYWPTIFHF